MSIRFLGGYASMIDGVRSVLLYLAVAAAAVCVIDWAIRTRRIGPFNIVARFFRRRIDPLMAPVERIIVRRGGRPAAAPWWTFLAIVVGGLLLIWLLQLVGAVLQQIAFGLEEPRRLPYLVASWAFTIMKLALIVRVVVSWTPISPYSRWVRWSFVLTEWMLAPLRRIIPLLGSVDITPIVAWLLLNILQAIL